MNRSGRPLGFDEHATLGRIADLFRRKGYGNTTFEQLVAESGLSRSSLYNTYGGKKELYEKSMRTYIETEFDQLIRKISDESSGTDAIQLIIDGFSNPAGRRGKDCLVRKTMLENAGSPKTPIQVSTIRRCLNRLWHSFTLAVSRRRGSGEGAGKDPGALNDEERAAILLGLVCGSAVIARNGKNSELLRSIRSAAGKLLLQVR